MHVHSRGVCVSSGSSHLSLKMIIVIAGVWADSNFFIYFVTTMHTETLISKVQIKEKCRNKEERHFWRKRNTKKAKLLAVSLTIEAAEPYRARRF